MHLNIWPYIYSVLTIISSGAYGITKISNLYRGCAPGSQIVTLFYSEFPTSAFISHLA